MDELQEILSTVSRIESKLDTQAANFDQHVLEDQLMARQVNLLSRQRGFIRSSLAVVGVGIGAAVAWAIHKVIGGGH